jgi:hypothetical protein
MLGTFRPDSPTLRISVPGSSGVRVGRGRLKRAPPPLRGNSASRQEAPPTDEKPRLPQSSCAPPSRGAACEECALRYFVPSGDPSSQAACGCGGRRGGGGGDAGGPALRTGLGRTGGLEAVRGGGRAALARGGSGGEEADTSETRRSTAKVGRSAHRPPSGRHRPAGPAAAATATAIATAAASRAPRTQPGRGCGVRDRSLRRWRAATAATSRRRRRAAARSCS